MRFGIWSIALLFLPLSAFADIVIPKAGWYLVSFGENKSASSILDAHPEVLSIWGYSGTSWETDFRETPQDNSFGNLTTIEPNESYWLRTSDAVTIPTNGSNAQSNIWDYEHYAGERFKAIGKVEGISASEFFTFFGDALPDGGTVWAWVNEQWSIYTIGDRGTTNQFNATHGTNFGTLREISANSGFFFNFGDETTTTTTTTTTTAAPTTTVDCRSPDFPPNAGDNRPVCTD